MAGTTLSIKLRCASWQQLGTIYRRDLSRGTMFLKASTQPPLGTIVRIDLELPSATVLELNGVIVEHVVDPQRGTGVDLKLEPLPTKSVWLIESALAAENKVRAQTASGTGETAAVTTPAAEPTDAIAESAQVAEAEQDLIRALEAEVESLKKLNPFLVLGVGYETTDTDVRAAFGELTKRYHPDRFARYQSTRLRQVAAEIFIVIRDAYRKLADEASRGQVRALLGQNARPTTPRAQTQPRPPPTPPPRKTGAIPIQQVPQQVPPAGPPPIPPPSIPRTVHDAPTHPSLKSESIASSDLAKPAANERVSQRIERARSEPRPDPAPGAVPAPVIDRKSAPVRMPSSATGGMPTAPTEPAAPVRRAATSPSTSPAAVAAPIDPNDASALDALLDEGKLDEALAGYRMMSKKNPNDRSHRAGIELVEGLRSLAARDRLEAAQRFESALEIDPSNERAARELADMRRQATNERKGLLSRLMGKKEGPP